MVSKRVLSASACAFGLAAAMIVSIAASPVRADAVVDWTFNNTLADASGNGNDGTLIGGGTATYVAGPVAGTYGISLTNQEVMNAAASNLPIAANSPWSINLWLNLGSAVPAYTWIGGFGNPAGPYAGGCERGLLSNGNLYFWGYGADLGTSTPYYTDNSWHMYTVTYSGATGTSGSDTVSMYLDSALVASGPESFSTAAATVEAGSFAPTDPWNSSFTGSIADFSVWNNCLSGAQVSRLQANPSLTTFTQVWTGTTNNDWSTNPSSLNWTGLGGNVYSDGHDVRFDDSGSGNTTISVSAANIAPASVTFNNNAFNYALTGAYGIAGTASLTLSGSGVVTLSNSNTYSGATAINAGTLVIAAAAGASPNSTFTINVNNGLAFGAGVTAGTLGGLSGSGGVTLTTADSPGLPVALTVGGNGQSTSYSGVLSGGGGLVKAGSGTLTLFGANSYSGPTTVASGVLEVAATGALGAYDAARGPWNVAGTIIVDSGSFQYLPVATGDAVVLSGGTLVGLGSGALGGVFWDYSGGVTTIHAVGNLTSAINGPGGLMFQSNGAALAFNVDQGANMVVSSPVIQYSSAVGSVIKNGAGTLQLSGANTYTGGTQINAGVLNLGVAENAGTSGPLGASGTIVLGGGTLQYSPVNNYDYSGRFSAAANQAYNVDTNGQTVTWAAALSSSGGSLDKIGAGTLILSGANSYTGGTQVDGGTLQLGNASALGSSNGNLAVNGGALLDLNGCNASAAGLSGGGVIDNVSAGGSCTLTVGNNGGDAFSGVIQNTSGNVGLVKTGSGALTLSGANTYVGGTQINAGVLNLGVAENAGTSGPLGASGTIVLGGGTLQYSPVNNYDYSGRFSAAANQAYNVDTNGQTVTWAAALSSSGGSLDKIGAGTLILSGANTYSGATTISAGTLVIAAAAAASPSSTFTINVNNGLAFGAGVTAGTLGGLSGSGGVALTTADSPGLPVALTVGGNGQSTTYSGALSGGGGLVKTGSGTLTLFGANAYRGATTIANGTLQLAAVGGMSLPIANANFAAPVVTSGVYLYYANMTPTQQADFAWTAAGNSIETYGPAVEFNYPLFTTPPSGSQACSLQANSSISQTVNFTAPGSYSLAWSAEGFSSPNPIEVLVDGVSAGTYAPGALSWGNFVEHAEYRHRRDPQHRVPGDGQQRRLPVGDQQCLPVRTDQRRAPRKHRPDGGGSIVCRRALRNIRSGGHQPDGGGPQRRHDLRRRNRVWDRHQQRPGQRRADRRGHEPIRRRACRRSEPHAGPDRQRRQSDAHWPEHVQRSDDGCRRRASDEQRRGPARR